MDESSDIAFNQVLATTHIVRQTVLTIESLHSAAADINEQDRKLTMSAEHDRLCPPMGQAVALKVVPIKDGHHALIGEFDIFPPPTEIELPSGEIGYCQQSRTHTFSFTTAEFSHAESFCVAIDPSGLGGMQETNRFFDELKKDIQIAFETQPVERRTLLPDPEVIFTLGIKASALWFGVRLAKAGADVIESELKAFLRVMIDAIKRTATNAIPKNRPVTYVLQTRGTPNLEFIARTRDAHAVISAMADSDLSDLNPKIDALRKRFDAEMIQFKMHDDGTWRFNYLLTKDGKVVGTKTAFDHRAVVLKEMEHKRKRIENARQISGKITKKIHLTEKRK